MMNQVVLVGRLYEIKEEGNKTILTLACKRAFKNENGEYEEDLIDFVLWGGVADNTKEYCKKGDIIGVKARIQSKEVDNVRSIELVADRITFLSNNPSLKKEED